jgi:conjugative transposon TraN protein
MSYFKVPFLIAAMLLLSESFAQPLVELSSNKTSTIVFQSPITTVDRGSRDVLAQKTNGVDNVLYLKAAKLQFRETNLTVITSDGKLHVFILRYADRPARLTTNTPGETGFSNKPLHIHLTSVMSLSELKTHTGKILKIRPAHKIKSKRRNKMELSLQDIYIKDNVLFFHLKISNESHIPFHTDFIRFYIKDRSKPKRTAYQEVGKSPMYCEGKPSSIKGKSSQVLVYAIPVFTIPDAKMFVIELMEKDGGRNLNLEIGNRSIMRARPLSF